MNWFGTPLPIISSSQGFHRVLSRCSPFFIDISRAWAQKNVIDERKKWRAAGLLFQAAPSQAFFSYSFPVIHLVTASCPPARLAWGRGCGADCFTVLQ